MPTVNQIVKKDTTKLKIQEPVKNVYIHVPLVPMLKTVSLVLKDT